MLWTFIFKWWSPSIHSGDTPLLNLTCLGSCSWITVYFPDLFYLIMNREYCSSLCQNGRCLLLTQYLLCHSNCEAVEYIVMYCIYSLLHVSQISTQVSAGELYIFIHNVCIVKKSVLLQLILVYSYIHKRTLVVFVLTSGSVQ